MQEGIVAILFWKILIMGNAIFAKIGKRPWKDGKFEAASIQNCTWWKRIWENLGYGKMKTNDKIKKEIIYFI